ncbi:MAG: Uma2 family endonuclease [Phormidesmis priestleyi]|uniref:Uma2 family endonuclease n=1 Tax=Phormidesmis priestleyi TaxID=268141 RepID=A0A2W4YIR2_9CYAN|nr:MAG: Uma2 family endonuclease [Phormidesmis priestleyi]
MQKLLARKTSLTEYLLLPYDGTRTEFANGEIFDMADPSPLHVFITAFIQQLLNAHIKAQGKSLFCFGPTGVEIPRADAENNVRSPDKVVSDRAQWRAMKHLTKAVFAAGNPPALAIEVASPGNTRRDTVDKRLEYALAKIPEYWIINPVDGYVLVLLLADGEYEEVGEYRGTELISSRLFPELKVSAATLLDPDDDDLLEVS